MQSVFQPLMDPAETLDAGLKTGILAHGTNHKEEEIFWRVMITLSATYVTPKK